MLRGAGKTAPVDALQIIASTAEAAFATDENGRIVIWNPAAEKLLGHEAAHVLGKPCHEVLCGVDVFGNRFCDQKCALTHMVQRREAMHHFEMDVQSLSGPTFRAAFSIVVVPGPRPSQHTLVHLLRPVERGAEGHELVRRILASTPAPGLPSIDGLPPPPSGTPSLTPREIQILRLMADGTNTHRIADSLFISQTTVRNHVQNILRKLEVHSKLEAVSLALRNRLI